LGLGSKAGPSKSEFLSKSARKRKLEDANIPVPFRTQTRRQGKKARLQGSQTRPIRESEREREDEDQGLVGEGGEGQGECEDEDRKGKEVMALARAHWSTPRPMDEDQLPVLRE